MAASAATEPVSEIRRLLRLAAPLMLGQLAMIGMGVTDVVVSGHAGTADLAGVTLGFYAWDLSMMLVFGIMSANGALIGHQYGAGSHAGVRRQFQQSLWLALPLSVLSGLAMWAAGRFVWLLDAGDDVAAVASGYLLPMIGTAVLVPLAIALRTTCEGLGLPRPVMWLNIGALLLNVPLNIILAFGLFGLPRLGGAGCGWATLIAITAMTAGSLVWLLRAPAFAAYRLFADFEPPRRAELRTMLALGTPIGIALLGIGGFFALVPLVMARLGATALGGHSVAMTVDMLMVTVPLGVGQAMSVRVSHELGAGSPQGAHAVVRTGMLLLGSIAFAQASMLVLLRAPIAALITQDAAVLELGAQLLLFAAAYRIFDSVQIGAEMTLRGYKDTRVASALHITAYWVVGLPLCWTLGFGSPWTPAWGVQGFWAGIVISIALASTLMAWRLAHTSTRHLRSAAGGGAGAPA